MFFKNVKYLQSSGRFQECLHKCMEMWNCIEGSSRVRKRGKNNEVKLVEVVDFKHEYELKW